jgi:hypothetical protein
MAGLAEGFETGRRWARGAGCVLGLAALLAAGSASGELCTTQSQMTAADRNALAGVARTLAQKVQANDQDGIKSLTVSEYAQNFGGIGYAVGTTSPKIKGGALAVEQVYLLDGTMIKKQADGTIPDAQFFCSLNKTPRETDFIIPGLPAGLYAFAMVNVEQAQAWRLSFLLRKDGGQWLLAGFFPKAETAAGHDGLWYWKTAREYAAQKQMWDAWLYYQTAQTLLRPAGFVQSTHLEALRTEQAKAAPPALSEGINAETPLVVKGADGTEYRFTSLDTDDSLGKDKVDVTAHMKAEPIADPAAARKRNDAATAALVAAYPELRKAFHGVWIFADTGAGSPFATEQAMTDVP